MIEICFPNNNEKEFLDIAKKLNLDGIVFFYKENNIKENNLFSYILIQNLNKDKYTKKGFINILPIEKKINKKKIYLMEKLINLTQVRAKELCDENTIVGFPYSIFYLESYARFVFLIRLFNKYKVKYFFASFAKDSYELRAKKDYETLGFLFNAKQIDIVTFL